MAFLTFMTGIMTGQRVNIDRDEITIGRADTNAIKIDDAAVSSRHCSILRDGRKYALRDNGSTNGTTVNKVDVKELRLKPKDVISVGSVEIMFDGDDVEVDPSTKTAPIPFAVKDVAGGPSAPPIGGPSPFGARKQSKLSWMNLILAMAALALILLAWFVVRLVRVGG